MLLGQGSGAFPNSSGEKKIFKYLLGEIKEINGSYLIMDVGANEGQFLEITLQEMTNNNFSVICFEPVAKAYEILEQKFGNSDNIILEKIGLDNFVHTSEIFYDQPGSLRASKYLRDLRHLGITFLASEIVRFTTLDKYCAVRKINQIDLLKIDVEGNELNILKGAKRLLEKRAIKLITFEFGRAQIDSGTFFKDIYYFLSDFGMKKLFRILPNGYLKPILKYDEQNEIYFTTNYLVMMV
jgi:FkbM family methyltransferase